MIPQTQGLKQDLFSHGSGGGKSKIKVLVKLVSPEASPWLQMAACLLTMSSPGLFLCICASLASLLLEGPEGLEPQPYNLILP